METCRICFKITVTLKFIRRWWLRIISQAWRWRWRSAFTVLDNVNKLLYCILILGTRCWSLKTGKICYSPECERGSSNLDFFSHISLCASWRWSTFCCDKRSASPFRLTWNYKMFCHFHKLRWELRKIRYLMIFTNLGEVAVGVPFKIQSFILPSDSPVYGRFRNMKRVCDIITCVIEAWQRHDRAAIYSSDYYFV